jgi:hypothetical protein
VEGYSTNLFSARAEAVIGDHDPAAHGLFLYHHHRDNISIMIGNLD